MTTATLDRAANPSRAEGHYGFRTVAEMEWLKLRSVRSTWWTLLVFAAGMIRATLAAVPRRPLLLAAKAAVLAAVALVVGEIFAFTAFAVGELALHAPAPHATLGQPGVLRAVLMGGAYPCLIALIALGLGAIVRNTAAAISAVVGMLFVIPLILLPLGTSIQQAVGQFLPMLIAENSLTAVTPQSHTQSPGVGFAVLCGYAAVALVAGGWALARRDA